MKLLDLHGVKHDKASDRIRQFLNFVDLPCEIVTGNSSKMKEIVRTIVKEYNWECYEKDNFNYGTLIINERYTI